MSSDEWLNVPDADVIDVIAGSAPSGSIEVVDRSRSLYRINGVVMRVPGPMLQQ